MTDTPVRSAGRQLREEAGELADAVVACEFRRAPAQLTRHGPGGRAKSRRDALDHLAHLAGAVDANSPALFSDYLGWVKTLLEQHGERGADLDIRLRCMAEVVAAKLPSPAVAGAVEMIQRARLQLPSMPSTVPTCIDPGQRLSPLALAYMHELLGGFRQAAGRLVFDAAERGETVRDLYLQVFQPALREVGRLWQMNRISVAHEHFCSASTQIVMSQLAPRPFTNERRGHSVVVACVSGELHDVGARMIADFFEMAGWDAYCCGANTPSDAIVRSVIERAADVLAVSVTIGAYLHVVQQLVGAVRAVPLRVRLRIMVGGYPFGVDPALWQSVGADGTANDADLAVTLANRWLAAAAPSS